jgi:zinc transporter, ZIP family
MELAQQDQTANWRATWLAQAHAHPYTSVGLTVALATVAWLLIASMWQMASGEADAALRLGMLAVVMLAIIVHLVARRHSRTPR